MARRREMEEKIEELILNLEELHQDFAEEAERRSRIGGYSADPGSLQMLCQTASNYAKILSWLVEESRK